MVRLSGVSAFNSDSHRVAFPAFGRLSVACAVLIPPPGAGGARRPRVGYVYLLKSRQDGTSYVGWTTDVLRRLVEHNAGQTSWTRRKRPWQLIGFETHPNVQQAKDHERMLKKRTGMLNAFKKRLLNQAASCGQRQVVG